MTRGMGRQALPGTHWEAHQPSMAGMAYGVPQRMAQLTAIGNAVVPQIVEAIGRTIADVR
jgi:site-specific DNA-cytosine methylase